MAESAIQTVGLRPAAGGAFELLYTCPTDEAVVHITWSVEGAATTIGVQVRAGGAAAADAHNRIGPDFPVSAEDASEKRSITLVLDDEVWVQSLGGNVTFQVSGVKRTTVTPAPSLAVTDGVTTVSPVTTITFTAAGSVADLGGGNAEVDNTGGGGGGDNISVNGTAATDADFDDATPAAPAGGVNVKWQKDAGTPNNVSAHLAANDVSNTVLRDSAAFSVIGKATTGAGDPADIAAGTDTVLGRNGSADLAFGQVQTGQIADNAVTDAKLRDSGACSVIGRNANSTGDPADISATVDRSFLRRVSNVLGFATIASLDLPMTPVVSPAQITANQNNYAPGDTSIFLSIIRLTSDASYDITGLASGVTGRIRLFVNANASGSGFNLRFMHENAGSTAANRIIGSGMANHTIAPGQMFLTWYDGTDSRWRGVGL